jgi:hypothetical protein
MRRPDAVKPRDYHRRAPRFRGSVAVSSARLRREPAFRPWLVAAGHVGLPITQVWSVRVLI